jgi:competence protein ComEA
MEHAMRERGRSVRRLTLELEPAERASGLGPLESLARAFGGRAGPARAASVRIWAPIAWRALALGIALLGLAGIGSVVARAPAPLPKPSAPGVSHAELGFGALSARALAVLSSAGSPDDAADAASAAADAGLSPSSPAPPALASPEPEPSSAPSETGRPAPGPPTRAAPCPELRDEPAARAPGTQAPVVLNRADAAELQRLPGVGAKRAAAILALRQRLGRFRRPSDLLRVKGIGPRTLERMLPHLVLD